MDAFGPERCVLGSNWPLDRLFSSYDIIMEVYRQRLSHLLDHAGQGRVMFQNAAAIYGLDLA